MTGKHQALSELTTKKYWQSQTTDANWDRSFLTAVLGIVHNKSWSAKREGVMPHSDTES